MAFDPKSPDGLIANDLLIALYKVLSYAANYYILPTEAPFRSIGKTQTEMLRMIIERILSSGHDEEELKKCVSLLYVETDPNEYDLDHALSFVHMIRPYNDDDIVIKLIDEMIKDKKPLKRGYDHTSYERIERYNRCVVVNTFLYMLDERYDKAISYFHKAYYDRPDSTEFVLLEDIIRTLGLKELWVKEYEASYDKIKDRNDLKAIYARYKEELGS